MKKTLFYIFLFLLSFTNVTAKEKYFTQEQLENLSNIGITESDIINMTDDEYEKYKTIDVNFKYKTMYSVTYENEFGVEIEEMLTPQQYKDKYLNTLVRANKNPYQTDSKIHSLGKWTCNGNKVCIRSYVEWTSTPNIKSIDYLGLSWENSDFPINTTVSGTGNSSYGIYDFNYLRPNSIGTYYQMAYYNLASSSSSYIQQLLVEVIETPTNICSSYYHDDNLVVNPGYPYLNQVYVMGRGLFYWGGDSTLTKNAFSIANWCME